MQGRTSSCARLAFVVLSLGCLLTTGCAPVEEPAPDMEPSPTAGPTLPPAGWQVRALDEIFERRPSQGTIYFEIFDYPTLQVGLYELAASAEDPQSPHARDEIYIARQGDATLRIDDGEEVPVERGTVVYVRGNVRHRFHDIGPEGLEVVVVFTLPPSAMDGPSWRAFQVDEMQGATEEDAGEGGDFFSVESTRVALYELPAGAERSTPLVHSTDAIYLVVEGEGSFDAGERVALRPEQLIYVVAGEEHRFEAGGEGLSLLLVRPPESP